MLVVLEIFFNNKMKKTRISIIVVLLLLIKTTFIFSQNKNIPMDFKYFENYNNLSSFTKDKVECQICKSLIVCFNSTFYGLEKINHICPNCIFNKKIYDRDISLNEADISSLILQLRDINKGLDEKEIIEIANKKTKELEKATPQLIAWQGFEWPCLDGDYAKFIGFGSKPFFNSLAPDGKGKKLFKKSITPELMNNLEDDFWDNIPDKLITTLNKSNDYSALTYVFKSLLSEKIVILMDQD